MGNPIRFLLLAFLVVVVVVMSQVFFTVREDKQALVLQFGAPQGAPINRPGTDEAGLHVKLPFIQNVVEFDRKNLEFDLQNSIEIIVANEQRLLVDAFVRYRIIDPLLYFQSLGSSDDERLLRRNFNTRLNAVLGEAMRGTLGSVEIRDIITARRVELMQEIQAQVTEEARKLGVQIIDVRIRQADFPLENAQRVYDRMVSDYSQQAARLRAEGDRRAQEVKATADKQVTQIRAKADEESQRIRGRAEATRNCIFAGAYQGLPVTITDEIDSTLVVAPAVMGPGDEAGPEITEDPVLVTAQTVVPTRQVTCDFDDPRATGDAARAEFFRFYRSLAAYEMSLGQDGTTMVMSPDSDFFRYFRNQNGGQ